MAQVAQRCADWYCVSKPCPCGCGRRLGSVDMKLANRSLRIQSLLPVFQHQVIDCDDDVRASWQEALETGKALASQFLHQAHQSPVAGASAAVVDAAETNRKAADWEETAMVLLELTKRQNPKWFAFCAAPPRRG